LKNSSKIVLFVSLGLAVLLVLAVFIYSFQNNSRHDWTESYEQTSTEPYGTSLLAAVFKNHFGKGNLLINKEPLTKALAAPSLSKIKNYIFIGSSIYLSEDEADTLLSFVAKGNNAFMALESIPEDLESALKLQDCSSTQSKIHYQFDSVCHMRLAHPNLDSVTPVAIRYAYRNKPSSFQWSYFKFASTCDTIPHYASLGYADSNRLNFIRVPHGKGFFFFHLNPLAFTNYELIHEPCLAYTEKVFSHLGEGKTCWDESNRVPGSARRNGKDPAQKGPLSYLLSQTPIRWAWYTLLLLVLSYFLFRAARRQRIIPVILPNENTSLEFVQTVGSLYYQQNDHQKLVLQKMKLFLQFIRSRYYLQTNVLNESLIQKIAVKSQIPVADIEKIVKQFNAYQNTVVALSEEELIAFHKSIEFFYRNCK
jgi:hypothetical protein